MKKSLQISVCAAVLLLTLTARAQDAKEDEEKHRKEIETVASGACDCTREIATDIQKDSIVAKINSCITVSIVTMQMNQQMGSINELAEKALQAEGDTAVGNNTTYTIYANKDFDEVQDYMFENCANVKKLMGSNDIKSNKSMSKNAKALEYYEEGNDYMEDEKYDLAIVSFNNAVKKDKDFAFAWDNMGLCYRKRGNYEEAIKCYEQSIKIDPTGLMPRQCIGVAYLYLKDYKKAGEAYEGLIKYDPKNPEGYYGAGRAFYMGEDYVKGADYMFKAYVMYKEINSPYVGDAESLLGAMYSDLEQKGKADIFIKAAKDNGIELD